MKPLGNFPEPFQLANNSSRFNSLSRGYKFVEKRSVLFQMFLFLFFFAFCNYGYGSCEVVEQFLRIIRAHNTAN